MISKGIAVSFFSLIYQAEIGVGYIFIANLLASYSNADVTRHLQRIKISYQSGFAKTYVEVCFAFTRTRISRYCQRNFRPYLNKNLSADNLNDAMHNVGVYSACFKIAVIMSLFIQAFRYSAEPFFFEQFKEKDAKTAYSVVMTYFVIVCSLIFLGTTLYLDFIKYFVSKPYHEGLHIVPPVLLAYMMLGIVFNLSIWYKLTGKTKYGAYISVGGAVITLIVNFSLIPLIGYTGAAWAHFITYFCMMIASYWLGQNIILLTMI